MKIDLLHLKQEQDHTCVPACIRIVFHHLGFVFSEAQICAACKTTALGTDQNEAAEGITLLGFKATMLKGAEFNVVAQSLRQGRPVIVFLSVNDLPYGGYAGLHAVVVNGVGKNEVSFVDPSRGEEIAIDLKTFLKAWQARGCRCLLIESSIENS